MSSKRLPSLIAALAVALAIFTHTASADSYTVFNLGSDDSGRLSVYGIDTSGDLVVENSMGDCSGPFSPCYFETSATGVSLGETALPPSLSYDNGSPCTGALPAGFISLGGAVCNNGHEVIGGAYYNPTLYTTLCAGPISGPAETIFCGNGGYLPGVFTGSDPFADWIGQVGSESGGGEINLNFAGDFGFDGSNGNIYLAIDQTPEPGTMSLVGTGCLAFFSLLRRRFTQA